MCGIAGFCDFNQNLLLNAEENRMLAARMGKVLTHRGPDDAGVLIDEHIAFAHTRLAVIDPERGKQPMRKHWDGVDYIIVYNGELYNTEELREGTIAITTDRGYIRSVSFVTQFVSL